MKDIIIVFAGGGIGSICRYLISKYLNPVFSSVPLGTLTVNVIACVVLGIVAGLGYAKTTADQQVKMFVIIGFCGGLSTFSTFNVEIFQMLKSGGYFTAGIYIILSLSLCLVSFVGANFIFSK